MVLGQCLDSVFTVPISLFLGYLVLASARFVRPCARSTLQLAPPTTTPFPRKVEAAVHMHVARFFQRAVLSYSQGLMRSPLASTNFCKRSGSFRQSPSTS